MTDALQRLAAHPRAALGHWPTPLERLDRLRSHVGGPGLWIKRDDCSGLAIGGNKTRKLEFLLGAAVAEAADGVITFGAVQSNHARQTAAGCARLGLSCDLILTRSVDRTDEHYLHSGNLLLDGVLGARLHVVDDPDAAFTRFAELLEQAESEGRTLYGIGPGGSEPLGVLGYVAATVELAEQLRAIDVRPERIVVAASTAGTAAGLVLGAALTGLDVAVEVACVYEPAEATRDVLSSLIERTAEEFSLPSPSSSTWTVTDSMLGDGYGIPTDEAMAAIDLLARTEGILLDPVYTAKAFAHLLARIDGYDGDVVFIHTGGSPGLFAYTSDVERPRPFSTP